MSTPAYFISDVHLTLHNGSEERERRRRLFEFFRLVARSHGSLYLVGDFFDFWFEYRHVIPRGYFDVIAELYRLRQAGVPIHFVLGNHDYWTDNFLSDQLGIQIHTHDLELEIEGRRFYLTHGDGLLAEEGGYRLLRKILRSRICIFLYRWLHPDWGIALAQSASRLSRKHNGAAKLEDGKIAQLTKFAQNRWDDGSDCVVMGHYHLNRLIDQQDGKSFLCLGDWLTHFTYGQYVDGKLSLESLPS